MKLTGDRCQCAVCGKYFNSTHAFDTHRTGEWLHRRCLDDTEMVAKGMGYNKHGLWVSEKLSENGKLARAAKRKSGDRPAPAT